MVPLYFDSESDSDLSLLLESRLRILKKEFRVLAYSREALTKEGIFLLPESCTPLPFPTENRLVILYGPKYSRRTAALTAGNFLYGDFISTTMSPEEIDDRLCSAVLRINHHKQYLEIQQTCAEKKRLLDEKEQEYRSAQEMAKMGSWTFHLDSGLVSCSENTRRIYGLKDDTELSIPAIQKIPLPEYRADLDKAMADHLEKGIPYDMEFEIQQPATGKIRDVHSVARYNDQDQTLTGFIHDITENKIIQRALEASEEKYRRMFDDSKSIMLLIDPDTGRIIDANSEAISFYGYSRSIFRKMKIQQINQLTPKEIQQEMENARNDRRNYFIFRHKLASGEIRDVEVFSGSFKTYKKDLLYSIIHDITPQKKAERLQQFLFSISTAINVNNDLSILYQRIHTLIGKMLPAENIIIGLLDSQEESLELVYFRDEKDQFKQTTFRLNGTTLSAWMLRKRKGVVLNKKKIEEIIESENLNLHGTLCKCWMGTPLLSGEKIIGLIIMQSYTDSQAYNSQDLQLMEFVSIEIAQAIQRQRAIDQIQTNLKEKEVLLKELHHRTKNNMQIIRSLIQFYTQTYRSAEVKQMADELSQKIQTMALVHEKLYQGEDLSRINLGEYLDDLITLLDHSLQTRRPLHYEMYLAEDIFVTIETAIPLGLAINELLTNIYKYAFDPSEDGTIQVNLQKKGENRVFLQIGDDGKGFPEDFDPRSGNTLGLRTVFALIESQLNGQISFHSKQGLVWEMRFPLHRRS